MKVALCLSGLIRDFQNSGFSYNEYLCKDLDCDIFIHTWDENKESHNTRFSSSIMDDSDNKSKMFANIFPNSNITLLLEDFNSDWNFRKQYQNDIHPRTTAIMYYSIYRSNLLKKEFEQKNNFVYDVVIRSRMDFLMQQKINNSELKDVCSDKNNIYVGTNLYHKGNNACRMNWITEGGYPCVEDQFAFGASCAMDKYSNCYIESSGMQYEGGEITLAKQFLRHNLKPIRTSLRFQMLQYATHLQTTYWEDYETKKQTIFNLEEK